MQRLSTLLPYSLPNLIPTHFCTVFTCTLQVGITGVK